MSRQIDTSGRLTSDDIIYLAQREGISGNQIPERYAKRIDPDQLARILSGSKEKLKLLPAKAESAAEEPTPDAPLDDDDDETQESTDDSS